MTALANALNRTRAVFAKFPIQPEAKREELRQRGEPVDILPANSTQAPRKGLRPVLTDMSADDKGV